MMNSTTIDIVIVDDNTMILENIRYTLEKSGWVVKDFLDPEECLAELLSKPLFPRLIVSDYNMGIEKMNGISLTIALKHSSSHKHIPIIILSAEASLSLPESALQAGAVAWIDKMAIHNQLLPAVHQHILPI